MSDPAIAKAVEELCQQGIKESRSEESRSQGISESSNQGIREARNQGIKESKNLKIKESLNQGMLLLESVCYIVFCRRQVFLT